MTHDWAEDLGEPSDHPHPSFDHRHRAVARVGDVDRGSVRRHSNPPESLPTLMVSVTVVGVLAVVLAIYAGVGDRVTGPKRSG